MKRIPIILAIAITAGCENRTEKNISESDSSPVTNPTGVKDQPADDQAVAVTGCYMQVLQRDTFTANLQQDGNNIRGNLTFDNFEKDGSSGVVNGKIDNDVIKLFYSFASEGMNSIMEVYFRQQGGSLVRGIGEMNTRGDTAYFVNPAAISYTGSELKKIGCTDLPAKYR
jgi:hypothetical protein